jgi:ADP-heptose:LPS heptosyltransferase
LLTTKPFEKLALQSGYFDEVWTGGRPGRFNFLALGKLISAINGKKFARVYDLQNNDRTQLYFNLLPKKPVWVGAAAGASIRNDNPTRTTRHAYYGHCQTLALAGIRDVTLDKLEFLKSDLKKFDLPNAYVLIVPGCSPTRPEKKWPTEKFIELCRALALEDIVPVLLGGKAEKELCAEIQAAVPQARNLAGATDMADMPSLARSAMAAVGNDTGPMHIISLTDCPSVFLFSEKGSDIIKHGSLGGRVQTISASDIADISATEVLEKLKRLTSFAV